MVWLIEELNSERRGREAKVPKSKGSGKFQSIREASFQINGPRLFNSLPKAVRNTTKVGIEEFKLKLDKYLESIPDEPKMENYLYSKYMSSDNWKSFQLYN